MELIDKLAASLRERPDSPGKPASPAAGVRPYPEKLIVFAVFLVVAFLFHAAGLNIFRMLVGGGDGFTAGLPSKLFAVHLSPWNPYVQLGQSSFANTQFQPFYLPALLIMAVFPSTFGYNLFILSHYALAGLFFYCFARNMRKSAYAALFGGLMFMLSGFLVAHKGHQAMMSAAVWLPLMLLFMDRYAETFRLRELASASLALTMSILAGFPQVTLYSMMMVAAYTVFRFSTRPGRRWTRVLWDCASSLGAAASLSILLSSLQLFAVAEALPQMTREKLTYGMFSENYLPFYHWLTFVIPNMLGGFFQVPPYSPLGDTVEVYPYMGMLPLGLALMMARFYRRKSKEVTFWAAVAVVALILALGQTTPLNALLFHIPVYNLFRAPARHLLEVNFAIAVLATMALDFVVRAQGKPAKQLARNLLKASSLLGAIVVIALGVSQAIRSVAFWSSMPQAQVLDSIPVNWHTLGVLKPFIFANLSPDHRTIIFPVVFFALSFLAMRLMATERAKRAALAALPFIFIADAYLAYSTLYDTPDTFRLGRPEALPDTAFLADQKFDKELYRIFPVDQAITPVYPLLNMTYGWSAINDQGPMWLKRYVTMTGFALNGAILPSNLSYPNVLAAAGARYLITRSSAYAEPIRAATVYGPLTKPLHANTPMLLDRALRQGEGQYLLKSPDGKTVSLIQAPITLRRSMLYRISFSTITRLPLSAPLLLNLYSGADYDNPEQYKVFAQLPGRPTRHTVTIDSGAKAPESAFLRIFTQSTAPIEVSDIQMDIMVPSDGKPLHANTPMLVDHALRQGEGQYLLKSPDGKLVSLIQAPITLRRSMAYRISFSTRTRLPLSAPLLLNLYNDAGYDNPAQYKVFAQLPGRLTRHTVTIDSGPKPPESAFLRIFTQSTAPIEVSDIQMEITVPSDGEPAGSQKRVYEQVYGSADGLLIFYNRRALPRFRFAKFLRPCAGPNEAREVLYSDPVFNVADEALVEGLSHPVAVEPGEIVSRTITNNRMDWRIKSGVRSFFIVADSWSPGWIATVDGKPARIEIVDGFLRGIMIEGAGTHEVQMVYRPWSVPAGFLATAAGLAILGLIYYRDPRVPGRNQ